MTIGDADLPHGGAHECGDGGARGTPCTKDQRGAWGASSVEQRIKCAAQSGDVSVSSNKTAPSARDRIDGADRCGLLRHRVEQRTDRLLVGDRDVGTDQIWIGAQRGNGGGESLRRHIHQLVAHWEAEVVKGGLLEGGGEAVRHRVSQEHDALAHARASRSALPARRTASSKKVG